MKVQRDIARSRRKRLILLATRLTFFVLLPTLLVSFYFYRVATPMYATHSEFIIQKAESGAGARAAGSAVFSAARLCHGAGKHHGAGLSSKAARRCCASMRNSGFRDHFSQPEIDPLTRIADDATVEDAYDTYLRNLRSATTPPKASSGWR
jgi:capsular polysaccharide transport system permease protein